MNIFKDDLVKAVKNKYQTNKTFEIIVNILLALFFMLATTCSVVFSENYVRPHYITKMEHEQANYLKSRFDKFDELVISGQMKMMRLKQEYFYSRSIDSDNVMNESKFIDPAHLEKSNICNSKNIDSYSANICESYYEFKKSMVYLDKYQYNSDCLLKLIDAEYARFNECVKPIEKTVSVKSLIQTR